MKRILIVLYLILSSLFIFAQEGGYKNNFDDNNLGSGWEYHNGVSLKEQNNELKISGNDWDNLWLRFTIGGILNLSYSPYLSLRIKSDTAMTLRIFFSTTTKTSSYIDKFISKTSDYDTLFYDFTNLFGAADPADIRKIEMRFNPNSNFKGAFYIDDLALGDSAHPSPSVCIGTSAKIDTLHILIASDSIALLEEFPFSDTIVHGEFIDGKGIHYPNVELNYRGAFALLGLIFNNTQRNWKVKFNKDKQYLSEREWNYNYQTEANENFAYDVLRKAGVKVVSSRIVVLYVNGVRQGTYLEFDDPDNKEFLQRSFGDDKGDLYKSATDLPYHTSYYGGLNYLGKNDSDYYYHYQKKTNEDAIPPDYSSIRKFIHILAFIPSNQFVSVLTKYFDTQSFIKYLVISNFMSHWDSYPQRPKNFWIYNRPSDNKWFYIPWDLNGTFEMRSKSSVDHMGIQCNIFYQFFTSETINYDVEEDTAKLLVRRMMMYAQFRNAYVLEYEKAIKTYLHQDSLYKQLDALSNFAACNLPNNEFQKYVSSIANIKTYIDYRNDNVEMQLKAVDLWDTLEVTGYSPPDTSSQIDTLPNAFNNGYFTIEVFPNPFCSSIGIGIASEFAESLTITITDIRGVQILSFQKDVFSGTDFISIGEQLPKGIYLLSIRGTSGFQCIRKIIKI